MLNFGLVLTLIIVLAINVCMFYAK